MKYIIILSALITIIHAQRIIQDEKNGCDICALYGVCDKAYKHTNGQFCLVLNNNKPCCCPENSVCIKNNHNECLCRYVDDNDDELYIVYILLTMFIIFIVIMICIFIEKHTTRYRKTNYYQSNISN